MRDPARQAPNRLELLRVPQLIFGHMELLLGFAKGDHAPGEHAKLIRALAQLDEFAVVRMLQAAREQHERAPEPYQHRAAEHHHQQPRKEQQRAHEPFAREVQLADERRIVLRKDARHRLAVPAGHHARKADAPRLLFAHRRRPRFADRRDVQRVFGELRHPVQVIGDPDLSGEKVALRRRLAKTIVGWVDGRAADLHPALRHLHEKMAGLLLVEELLESLRRHRQLAQVVRVPVIQRVEERAIRAIDPNGIHPVRGQRLLAYLRLGPRLVRLFQRHHHVVPDARIFHEHLQPVAALLEEFREIQVSLLGALPGEVPELPVLRVPESEECAHERRCHQQQEQQDLRLNFHRGKRPAPFMKLRMRRGRRFRDGGDGSPRLSGFSRESERQGGGPYWRTRCSLMLTMRGSVVAASKTIRFCAMPFALVRPRPSSNFTVQIATTCPRPASRRY